MKFIDLQEIDRIQSIKDTFALLCEVLANDPAKFEEYFPSSIPPVTQTIKLISKDLKKHSVEDIEKIESKNKDIVTKINLENAKLVEEIETKKVVVEKIKAAISSLKKRSSCVCVGTKCIDTISLFGSINPDLEPLIDLAKKIAEQRIY